MTLTAALDQQPHRRQRLPFLAAHRRSAPTAAVLFTLGAQ